MRSRLLSPTSIFSGASAFGLLLGQGLVARAVIPHLIELLDTAPRLAMLGFLGLVLFPGIVTFAAHRVGSRFLDQKDRVAGASRFVESAWAGALSWLVVYGTTILTRMVWLVINPPQPDPDAFSLSHEALSTLTQASPANALSLFAGLWISIATLVFEIERRARGK